MPKAARAFVHVMRPNKKKPPGKVKRARKTAKKLRSRPVRTTLKAGRKGSTRLAKAGAHRAGTAMPKRTRHSAKPLFIRGSGGRFAGSRARLSPDRTSLTVRTASGRTYRAVRTSRIPLSLKPGKISSRSARHLTSRIGRADARGRQYGTPHRRGSRAAGRSISTHGHFIIGRV